MANYDDPLSIIEDVLFRMDEPTDGNSDFLAAVRRALIRAHHDFANKHPWPWLRSYPPGAFVTVAPIDTTITIAAAGETVAATLGASVATSLVGRKVLPAGRDWYSRITVHGAPSDAITLDAAPEVLAAGTEVRIVKDEYLLAADLGLFVDGLWSRDWYIPLKTEEQIRKEYSDKPEPSWPPSAFCRLDSRRIRLSHYPDSVKRVEYPYCTAPDDLDPTSSTELAIPHNWRWVLSDATLYFAYLMKSDKRVTTAKQDYEKAVEECVGYVRRMLMGIGSNPGAGPESPYR